MFAAVLSRVQAATARESAEKRRSPKVDTAAPFSKSRPVSLFPLPFSLAKWRREASLVDRRLSSAIDWTSDLGVPFSLSLTCRLQTLDSGEDSGPGVSAQTPVVGSLNLHR